MTEIKELQEEYGNKITLRIKTECDTYKRTTKHKNQSEYWLTNNINPHKQRIFIIKK